MPKYKKSTKRKRVPPVQVAQVLLVESVQNGVAEFNYFLL